MVAHEPPVPTHMRTCVYFIIIAFFPSGVAAWDCTSLYPVASLVRSARGLCSCYAVEATRSLCRDCACVGLC